MVAIKVRATNKPKLILTSLTIGALVAATRPVFLSKAFAANIFEWQRQEDLDRLGGYYSSAARSADGSSLILGVSNGGENGSPEDWVESPLFVSGNGGASWQNVAAAADPDVWNNWRSVDVSNNGQVMVAASDDATELVELGDRAGRILLSNDGGDSWQNITPADTDDWDQVVVSGDGQTIAALENDQELIYVTEDGGDNWVTTAFDDAWNVKSIAISDDGKIYAGGENNSSPYTLFFKTENGGDTWSNITPDQNDDSLSAPYYAAYNTFDVSADGEDVVLATAWGDDSMVYISHDGGDSWAESDPNAEYNAEWYDAAISDDGSTVSVVSNGEQGKMFVSTDSGQNWHEEDPGQESEDTNNYWQTLDINQDGSKVIIANDQNAYVNMASEPEPTPTVTLDDAESSKTITITTPDGTSITCHSAVKESGLTAQDAGYSYPHGLVDFCFSGANDNNSVSLVFVTNLKPSEVSVRKYNPTNKSYATVTDATITQTTYNSSSALLVSYNIADNGPLDTDPDAGEVADPVGIAVLSVSAPNTGLKRAE